METVFLAPARWRHGFGSPSLSGGQPAPAWACLALGMTLLTACGPSAQAQGVPPGHLEYDWRVVRIYRDGARVEHVPVREELGTDADELYEIYAKCFYLNERGVRQIEEAMAALDPVAEYPERECDNAPFDAYTADELYLDGFEHSPFICPVYFCYCNPALVPIASVHTTALYNVDGVPVQDENGEDLWYLDTTRSCEPGEWRGEGS